MKVLSIPMSCQSVRNTLGCQVCVICNSKSFHSFYSKLCLMIVYILKICTSYFVHVSYFFLVLTGVELRHFFHPQCLGARCLVCVICNSNSIHSFIFKLCTMIIHTLKMRTSYFVHVSYFFLILLGVALGHFFSN